MIDFIRKIIYSPSVNYLLRSTLKPFVGILPKRFRFPVVGTINVALTDNKTVQIVGNQTSYGFRVLFWGGIKEHDYNMLLILFQMVKESSVLIEIGANIGYYTVMFVKINPGLTIYAFEPSPGSYSFLISNIKLNKMDDAVHPFKLALSDKEGKTTFYQHNSSKTKGIDQQLGGSSSLALDQEHPNEFVAIDVDVSTLDHFINEKNITRVDIIKMDTEATEHLVLAGGESTISNFLPIIVCEVLHNKIEKQLESFFKKHNYRYFRLTDRGLVKADNLSIDSFKEDFFFVHDSKINLVEKYLVK